MHDFELIALLQRGSTSRVLKTVVSASNLVFDSLLHRLDKYKKNCKGGSVTCTPPASDFLVKEADNPPPLLFTMLKMLHLC